jgi:hypothetical protein
MKLNDYLITLILVAAILFLSLQKGNGFAGLFIGMFFVAICFNLIRMIRRRGERRRFLVRAGIWAFALVLSTAVQTHWADTCQREADRAVQAVLAYKARIGSYPASLKEAGLDGEGLRSRWGINYYSREGKMVLCYPSTFMVLTTYDYHFETGKWVVNAY